MDTVKEFHIIVRGCPDVMLETARLELDDVDLQTLVVPSSLQSTPLPVTFDQVANLLEAFPRLHLEPDGAFVWVSANDSPVAWQLEGNLCDRGDTLNHVEIKGSCIPEAWQRLLGTLGAAEADLMIEHVPLAIFMREQELQKLLA